MAHAPRVTTKMATISIHQRTNLMIAMQCAALQSALKRCWLPMTHSVWPFCKMTLQGWTWLQANAASTSTATNTRPNLDM